MNSLKRILVFSVLSSFAVIASTYSISNACSPDGKEGFAPENDWKIPATVKGSGISESQFNRIIDEVTTEYEPIIKARGGILKVNRLWQDATVNASAQRKGSTYEVNMFGGMARHPLMTADGFAMILCHELGHHIGGAPQHPQSLLDRLQGKPAWASNEGQSDYFASLQCMRRVYGQGQSKRPWVRPANIHPVAIDGCTKQFADLNEQEMCLRSAVAGEALARTLASLRASKQGQQQQTQSTAAPDLSTPDRRKAQTMFNGHPEAQCRLDTYFAGAICDKRFDLALSDRDPTQGTCSTEKGDRVGTRPLCWYKPL